MKHLKVYKINSNRILHVCFWLLVFIYYINVSWPYETNKAFLLERVGIKVILQIAASYIFLQLIKPHILKRYNKLLFVLMSIILVYGFYVMFVAVRCFYLLPKYPEVYSYRPPLVFEERVLDVYAFLNNIPDFIFPVIVLVVINFYKKEKEIAKMLEQQKSLELSALKSQLNPHFLFNTLNNLYAMTLVKSDKAPEVIEKLSKILDYMLYQCESESVSIRDELDLLKNYIDLEKVRYGKRVEVTLEAQLDDAINIAPLILLTFVENAFKHGVSQETEKASIVIQVKTMNKELFFSIKNSKPKNYKAITPEGHTSIGLKNIKRQLDLIYKNKYVLIIDDNNPHSFGLTLKLKTHGL
jgi:hypothetical protein